MFICVKGQSGAEIQTDTDDFLPPLRRLSPPPSANSHAKTACSDTLTEAGYARCGDENQPTVLSWILLSDLPILRDGTACHACIQSLKHFVACADLHREKKSERHWLFTPPLTINKRTAIRRLPTARNSKTVSFFRR